VVFLDQYSGDTLWEGRPDSLPAARQVAVLWSRPLHTGSFAGPVGQLLWGWLGLALVALGVSGYTTRRARLDAARLEKQRWRRRRRRRRTLARRLRARRVQAARERRRAGRRLRRRRTVQARLGRLTGAAATETDVPEAAEVDLTDDTLEIDLTDSAGEIDLRDDSDVRRG
jgi:hypothetical protein